MTHRTNAAPTSTPLRALAVVGLPLLGAAGLFVLGTATCCGRQEAPPTPPATPPVAAVRFEPVSSEHLDLAVGETFKERVVLFAEPPNDLRQVVLSSSCDCLSAAFVDPPTATRGEVELSIFGIHVDDVDGEIYVEDPKRAKLATFVSRIAIRRIPYVEPREVLLEKGSEGRFDLVIGQAFARDAKLPDSILGEFDPSKLDEAKLAFLDFPDMPGETTDDHVLLRVRLQFMVIDEAREKPFETVVPVEFGEPAVKRDVKVRWPGK